MKRRSGQWLLLAIIAGVVLLGWCWRLGEPPLAGTEGFRTITALQMKEQGNGLLPRLYDQLYLRKPPLHYWVLTGFTVEDQTVRAFFWRLPSALSGVALLLLLAGTTARWWGRAAGVATALAFASLIPLWADFRTAEIDALNTLLAGAASLAMLAQARAETLRWRTTLWGGVCLAGLLLCKGPAGLPPVIGAWIGGSLGGTGWRRIGHPGLWGMGVVGAAGFGGYAAAAWWKLRQLEVQDTSGLTEVANRLSVSRWQQWLEALEMLPTLFAYALPVSAVIVWAVVRWGRTRKTADRVTREASRWLAAWLIAVGVMVLLGIENPRYGYVTLPLLAPIAGVLAHAWQTGALSARERQWLARVGIAFTLILAVLAWGTTVFNLWHMRVYPLSVLSAVLALLGAGVLGWAVTRTRWRTAGVAYTLVLLGTLLSFADLKVADLADRGNLRAAEQLKAHVASAPGEVATCRVLWTHPELFYYADVTPKPLPRPRLMEPFDWKYRGWVVFHGDEWPAWHAKYPERLSNTIRLPTHVPGTRLTWYNGID